MVNGRTSIIILPEKYILVTQKVTNEKEPQDVHRSYLSVESSLKQLGECHTSVSPLVSDVSYTKMETDNMLDYPVILWFHKDFCKYSPTLFTMSDSASEVDFSPTHRLFSSFSSLLLY